MKKKVRANKFFPFLFLIPVLLILALIFIFPQKDILAFRYLTTQMFRNAFREDTLSLHYTVADPDSFHIRTGSPTLPVYSGRKRNEAAVNAENQYAFLSGLDTRRFSSREQFAYDLLCSHLKLELNGARFPYYEEPLSPNSGMQSQLPVLLAEYTFRNVSDLEDYLALLETIPAYLNSLAEYEKEKSQAGLFMTHDDALSVIEQCDSIMDPNLLSANEHFLQTTFAERLDELIQVGLLPKERKEYYIQDNNRILTTLVAPAYTALGDNLYLLSDTGVNEGGLCEFPEGKEYYCYLLQKDTGSGREPDEIRSMLSERFKADFKTLQALVAEYQTQTGTGPFLTDFSDSFPSQTPEEILADLQNRLQADFPPLSSLTEELPSCRTKEVTQAMEPYTSPAYYMTPPIDDLQHNTVYINRSSTSAGLELYTTLAHEGYPGHLYQTVYSQLYANSIHDNPARNLLFYGGYVEGWAYYVENLSYEYAAALLTENGGDASDILICRINALERDLQINLYCLIDMAIHYYGAAREDIYQTLAAFGFQNPDTQETIYNYIRTEPVNYLKYYLGYLEILSLRAEVQKSWGASYSLSRFHRFVLEAGPSDFTNLRRYLTAYSEKIAPAA